MLNDASEMKRDEMGWAGGSGRTLFGWWDKRNMPRSTPEQRLIKAPESFMPVASKTNSIFLSRFYIKDFLYRQIEHSRWRIYRVKCETYLVHRLTTIYLLKYFFFLLFRF